MCSIAGNNPKRLQQLFTLAFVFVYVCDRHVQIDCVRISIDTLYTSHWALNNKHCSANRRHEHQPTSASSRIRSIWCKKCSENAEIARLMPRMVTHCVAKEENYQQNRSQPQKSESESFWIHVISIPIAGIFPYNFPTGDFKFTLDDFKIRCAADGDTFDFPTSHYIIHLCDTLLPVW